MQILHLSEMPGIPKYIHLQFKVKKVVAKFETCLMETIIFNLNYWLKYSVIPGISVLTQLYY